MKQSCEWQSMSSEVEKMMNKLFRKYKKEALAKRPELSCFTFIIPFLLSARPMPASVKAFVLCGTCTIPLPSLHS